MYVGDIEPGLLGWAYYPERKLKFCDGVVILGESLPGGTAAPYNEGDTATHEVGHWLNLLHTFEQGCENEGDKVKDTPTQARETFGCPSPNPDTCPAPHAQGLGDVPRLTAAHRQAREPVPHKTRGRLSWSLR
jgi:hypothetical protein